MADFAAALRSRLEGAAGQAIHWDLVPASAVLPYVRLQVISDPRPEHLKGSDAARVSRVQADCFGRTHKEARNLALGVTAAVAEPARVGGVTFGRTQAEGPVGGGDDTTDGFVHRARLDLFVHHNGD